MAAITLRLTKGTPLTNAEIDGNFTNLNNELATKLNTSQYTASDILTKLKTVDGAGSGLDADLLSGKAATALNQVNTAVLRDASGNFAANVITANLTGNVTGNVSGNAGTVTNGVYTSGSYANPVWISSLAGSKVTSIPNSSLANSSITINGIAVSLGGSGSILNVTQTWTGVQTFRDNAFFITDNIDNSKRFAVDVAAVATGVTRTLTIPNANGTIALESYVNDIVTRTNTWTGAQTFRDNAFAVTDNADTTKRVQLELSSVATNTTRTLTVPNASGTIALESWVNNLLGTGVQAKGYISFNPSTGAVFTSRNLSIVRNGVGVYTITLAESIRTGNTNYAPIVSAIDSGNYQGSTYGGGTMDVRTVGIDTYGNTSFVVRAIRRYNTGVVHAGGNDGNSIHAWAGEGVDPLRITVAVF